jgi:hypothetical protein
VVSSLPAVGQADPLPLDVPGIAGRKDAEFVVQGEQFVRRPARPGGSALGALAAAPGVAAGLPVVTIPNPLHRRLSRGPP